MSSLRLQQKNTLIKWALLVFLVTMIIVGTIFANKHLKVASVNITFFDQEKENIDIKNFAENFIKQNSNTLFDFLFLNSNTLTKKLHEEFPIVDTVEINKNINMSADLVIIKNQKFFSTCMDGDQFLVRCALGNQAGSFYQEINSTASDTLNIQIVPEAIYDTQTEVRLESPDSISLNRIYTKADFANLREVINYFKKSYAVSRSEVGKLKVAKIYLNDFYIVINMTRSYIDTVKDFEIISRTGELKDYLNDKPKEILYVDLSYKNKVFFKLKSNLENPTKDDSMSTSTDAR